MTENPLERKEPGIVPGSGRAKVAFLTGTSLLAVFAAFLPYFPGLWTAWQTEEYSHGVLIPLVAVLMGWRLLADKKPVPAPSWWGLPVILCGFALLTVTQLSAFEPPAHYGLVACIAGIVLAFFGRKTAWVLAPAIAYLVFAIPLPRLIEVALTAKMQLASTTLGVSVLQALGYSVYQEGNIIDLGVEKLQVVEACSGLRYLFPLLSFGYLVAFLYKGAFWKRVVIFLSAAPLTLLMNALRIAVTGILVNTWGSEMADGLIHDFEGWAIFAVCVVVLLAETWALSKIGRAKEGIDFDIISLPEGPLFAHSVRFGLASAAALILCCLCAAALTFGNPGERTEIVPSRTPFAVFPLTVGDWRGSRESIDADILGVLKATDTFNADFRCDGAPASVNLFMAWYASQRVGVSAHSPSNCIPGSGWTVTERAVVPVDLGGATLPVTRMVIRKGSDALLVWYWFDQRGRIINEQYGAKWYLMLDSIRMNRTDGVIVRLTTPLADGEEDGADARLREFLQTLYPLLPRYLPD